MKMVEISINSDRRPKSITDRTQDEAYPSHWPRLGGEVSFKENGKLTPRYVFSTIQKFWGYPGCPLETGDFYCFFTCRLKIRNRIYNTVPAIIMSLIRPSGPD